MEIFCDIVGRSTVRWPAVIWPVCKASEHDPCCLHGSICEGRPTKVGRQAVVTIIYQADPIPLLSGPSMPKQRRWQCFGRPERSIITKSHGWDPCKVLSSSETWDLISAILPVMSRHIPSQQTPRTPSALETKVASLQHNRHHGHQILS